MTYESNERILNNFGFGCGSTSEQIHFGLSQSEISTIVHGGEIWLYRYSKQVRKFKQSVTIVSRL